MTNKTFEVSVPIPFHQDWVCCGINDAIGEGFQALATNYEALRQSDNTLRALLSISRKVTDGGPLKIDESGIDEKYLPIVDAILYAEKIRRQEDAEARIELDRLQKLRQSVAESADTDNYRDSDEKSVKAFVAATSTGIKSNDPQVWKFTDITSCSDSGRSYIVTQVK